jgi:hypothetical protein
VGLRFVRYSGFFAASEMDVEPSDAAKTDERARRARTIIVVLMALFIAAPFVLYLITGSRVVPTQ